MKTMLALCGTVLLAMLLLATEGLAQTKNTGRLTLIVRAEREAVKLCATENHSLYFVLRMEPSHKIVIQQDLCEYYRPMMVDTTDVCAGKPQKCPGTYMFFGLATGKYSAFYGQPDSMFQASKGARGSLKPLGYYVRPIDSTATPTRTSDPKQATILTIDPKKGTEKITLWIK
jgi:hypothetical protein